jgi:polyhydroxyalkanoate synthase
VKGFFRLASLPLRGKPPVGTTPADVVHAENKWRLLRYRAPSGSAAPRKATPVVIIPSLINRHYVLDLLPGRSFTEAMVQRGHDVYIVDWGTPEDEDRFLEFDEIADRYLGRAFRVATRLTAEGTRLPRAPHVLGYCLGGTLTAIHAAAHPESMSSLTLLAAPIGFHDEGLLSLWTRSKGFDVDAVVEGTGNVPWQLMQSAFQMLRPTMSAAKMVGAIDRAWEDEFLDTFHATETWGNDNVSFPGACYRRYIRELYQADALVKDAFTLSGRPARLASIRCPLLAVTFEHDHIVPPASAGVVMDRVSSTDKHRIHLSGGHVGAVISKKAAAGLWPAISTFWADRDGAPAKTAVAAVPAEKPAEVAAPAEPPHAEIVAAQEPPRAEIVAAPEARPAAAPAPNAAVKTAPPHGAKASGAASPPRSKANGSTAKKPAAKSSTRAAKGR